MLKSTHRPVEAPQPTPLPAPWTEHKAPTGHTYYYNPETKQSTYTRPAPAPEPPQEPQPLYYDPNSASGWSGQPSAAFAASPAGTTNQRGGQHRHFRRDDRPRSRHPIPGHAPWLLIKTRLKRRFVYNPDTRESFWKTPDDLIQGLVDFDIQERENKERSETATNDADLRNVLGGAAIAGAGNGEANGVIVSAKEDADGGEGSDEYEEVEVTDSEYESEGHPAKRRKVTPTIGDDGAEPAGEAEDEEQDYMIDDDEDHDTTAPDPHQTAELTEADMEAQLAAMGQSYDLDPTEYYHDQDGLPDEDAYELTAEEAETAFGDMLDDHAVNPYTTWDALIASPDSSLVNDDRYTLLSTMSARRRVFSSWSGARIAALKKVKAAEVKTNPRVPYLRFLSSYATPKLYWPEFKRKYKKEPEMLQKELGDKEREKLYREYILRMTKMGESQRLAELQSALKAIKPGVQWNRSSIDDGGDDVEGSLPEALLVDMRYATVEKRVRETLVREFVAGLQGPEEVKEGSALTEEERKSREERRKRDEAVRRRGEMVEARKGQQRKELLSGQRLLEAEERELKRAQKVGMAGLEENLRA